MRSQVINNKKKLNLFFSSVLCLLLTACGGSNNFKIPETPKDTTPPSIEDSLPDEQTAENFEVDFNVEITFSELMNADSLITEEGVKLFSGKIEQDSELELEPRESQISLSVVPVTSTDLVTEEEIVIPATKLILTHASGRFALNNSYTVSVEYPARDMVEDDLDTEEDERNFIDGQLLLDFTTEKGEWKVSKPIPNVAIENKGTPTESPITQNANQFSPMVISNSNGDAALFWRQELSAGITQLWASRYSANTKSWQLLDQSSSVCNSTVCANSELVSIIDTTNIVNFDADINEKGQIVVAWSQASAPSEFVSIYARLFDGSSWLETTDISGTGLPKTGNSDSPQVEIDQKGNVVSIWREHNGENSRIKTNLYKLAADEDLANGQWSEPPSFIDNIPQVSSNSPKLSMSKNGLAIAVWAQKQNGLYNIVSNHIRLNQSDDWIGFERIDFIDQSLPEFEIGDASLPQIAIDENNDALAIWLKHDGQRNNLWYNRFTGSWGAKANYVERDRLGDVDYPSVTFSKSNKALATWTQENKTTNSTTLMSSFFEATLNGWEENQAITSNNEIHFPVAKFDREGNAVLLWQEGFSSGDLQASYYSKLTKKWGKTAVIDETGNQLSISNLYEDGRFLAAWENGNLNSSTLKSVLFSD